MTPPQSEACVCVADAHDAGAIAGLRSLWNGERHVEPGFEERMASWLATEADRRTTWLALSAAEPAGMVSLLEYRRMPRAGRYDSCWGYVSNLFVREEVRDRGIGSALLAAVVAAAGERGYARLVVSPSERAVPLFGRAGFSVADGARSTLLLVRPGQSAK